MNSRMLGFRNIQSLTESPVQKISFTEDFIATSQLISATSGTGAANSSILVNSDSTHIGVQRCATGTDTGGRAGMQFQGLAFLFGIGEFDLKMAVKIPTLSDGTDTFTVRLGFGDTSSADSADGALFRYTNGTNSGKFEAITRNNSVETAADTGITVSADTWYKLRIYSPANGSSVMFYINDVLTNTLTTNIPTTAGRNFGGYFGINKSAGTTSRNLDVDYVNLTLSITTPRL